MGRFKEMMLEQEERGAFTSFDGNECVCSKHFEDVYLKEYVNQNSCIGTCSYCGEKDVPVIDMNTFMSFVTSKLSDRFLPLDDGNLPLASSYFDDEEDVVPGIRRIGCYAAPEKAEQYENIYYLLKKYHLITENDNLNSDIQSCFHSDYYIKNDAFELDLDENLSYAWNYFKDMVKYKKRYTFFQDAFFVPSNSSEDDILTEIKGLCETVLLTVLKKGEILYRCRPDYKGNVFNTFQDLTSAPKEFAKSNRMSAEGISIFYGAFDESTTIKEVGNYTNATNLSIGEFVIKKDLTVVDLFKVPEVLTFWMKGFYQEYKFLKQFHNEITQPIRGNSNIEYIPTQVFVEYLRYLKGSKQIDGIIYQSAVTGGKNIVLFYDNITSSEVLSLANAKSIVIKEE